MWCFLLSKKFKITDYNVYVFSKHDCVSDNWWQVTSNTLFLTLENSCWNYYNSETSECINLFLSRKQIFKAWLPHLNTDDMLQMGICKRASSSFVSRLTEGLRNFQAKSLSVPEAFWRLRLTNLKKKKFLEWKNKTELSKVTEHQAHQTQINPVIALSRFLVWRTSVHA